jgi:integrase/recombinase XerD
MSTVRWELYPLVAASELPRVWLELQSHLQLAPKTVDAYGRCLNDFLTFCQRSGIVPEALTREQVALYVHDLATRPNPKGAKILSIESGRGLSNATMQQRITILRLFCDSLVERQLRQGNPVGRGHYVPYLCGECQPQPFTSFTQDLLFLRYLLKLVSWRIVTREHVSGRGVRLGSST